MTRKVLIQFPTRERPLRFLKVLDQYYNLMEDKENYIINVCCDSDDTTMNNDSIKNEIESRNYNLNLWFDDNDNKIQATNSHISDCTENLLPTDIIILASDDMVPEINGWDNILREKMEEHFPDGDGVLHFNDGNWGYKLNTLSILGKKYFDRTGYIYNPCYISLYADNEFMEVSRYLKKEAYTDTCIIRHVHPSIMNGENHQQKYRFGIFGDALLKQTESYKLRDYGAYIKRKAEGFGLGDEATEYFKTAETCGDGEPPVVT